MAPHRSCPRRSILWRKCNVRNDDWNIDHRWWLKRCFPFEGQHVKKSSAEINIFYIFDYFLNPFYDLFRKCEYLHSKLLLTMKCLIQITKWKSKTGLVGCHLWQNEKENYNSMVFFKELLQINWPFKYKSSQCSKYIIKFSRA